MASKSIRPDAMTCPWFRISTSSVREVWTSWEWVLASGIRCGAWLSESGCSSRLSLIWRSAGFFFWVVMGGGRVTVWSPCLRLRAALSSRPSVGLPVAMECENGSARAGQCARQPVAP
jgi:hypothetical protein